MKTEKLRIKVEKLLAVELPKGHAVSARGLTLARGITLGRTLFLNRMGVASEAEYKRRCRDQGKIMYHAHIGMSTWDDTAAALHTLYEAGEEAGFTVDRFGLCLDRRMGLPQDQRSGVPAETGPILKSDQDWAAVGQVVPIQPHMGDFMIGFPAAAENTVKALEAGVTTIGNLSQFFAHEAPGWDDHVTTTVETVKAIAILAGLREQGVLLHSYLEDGYGALFMDCSTIAGWAYLERYIVEELLGAKLSHCIGGLTTDPVKRAGWVFALHEIHDGDCLGSMFYGDTISFTRDFTVNSALVSEYLLWDIMAQLECPSGHAVHTLPKTEGVRVPSVQEIVEAQNLGKRIEASAHRMLPHTNFEASYKFASLVVEKGKTVCANTLDGLEQVGVDICDPVQLLFVLKKLGPALFEETFGAGDPCTTSPRGRKPVVITDVFNMSQTIFAEQRPLFLEPENKRLLKGKRLLIASSDVHEHAIMLLVQLCSEAGAHCLYLGAEQPAPCVARAAARQEVDAILISTHNGMALEYAEALKASLGKSRTDVTVVMGGVLNQKVEGRELPIDVTKNLSRIGFIPRARLQGDFPKLLDSNTNPEESGQNQKEP